MVGVRVMVVYVLVSLSMIAIESGCASSTCEEREEVMVPTVQPRVLFEPSMAREASKSEVKRVEMLLSAHEFVAERAQLDAGGSEAEEALWMISSDPERRESLRLRAFELLAQYPGDEVRALYERAIGGLGPVRFQHRAVARFGDVWPEHAAAVLGQVLATSPDPQLRLTAAASLMSCCAKTGEGLLEKALEREKEDWVREKLQDYRSR